MVCHPALGKIVGPNPLIPHAGPHLAPALAGHSLGLLLDRLLIQAGPEDGQGPVLVLILAPLVLALHHGSGGQVGHPDGGLRLVDVLPARAGGAVGVNL